MKWIPPSKVSCSSRRTTLEFTTCYPMSTIRIRDTIHTSERITSICLIRLELVALASRATIVDQVPCPITLSINNRWDKPCSMVTSWPSWGRVTLAIMLQSITLITTLNKMLSRWVWWTSKQKEKVEAALLEQLHPALETIESELQVELAVTRTKIKLIFSTLWIRGKHQVDKLPNNNKWWWLHSSSTNQHTITLVCTQDLPVDTTQTTPQFPKLLPRPNFVSKEHPEVPAIPSIKVTKVNSVKMQLSTTMPSIKCNNSTRPVIITILVVVMHENNLCTVIRMFRISM